MVIKTYLGGFNGDEGKGKQTASDALEILKREQKFRSVHLKRDIKGYSLRSNGGPNGGHALYFNGIKVTGHVLPSTIIYEDFVNIIGAGCALHPEKLIKEINDFDSKGVMNGSLFIDDRAQIILDAYCFLDGARNGRSSTGSGISYVYGCKGLRIGIKARDLLDHNRLGEKLEELLPRLEADFYELRSKQEGIKIGKLDVEVDIVFKKFKKEINFEKVYNNLKLYGNKLKPFISNTISEELRDAVANNIPVLNETSQGFFLGIESGLEMGTSSPIHPDWIFVSQRIPYQSQEVTIIVKSFFSRVGEGYFIGEYGERANALKKLKTLEQYLLLNKSSEEIKQKAITLMNSKDPFEIGDGLRLYYNEFGETTGYPRGKAPFDLVAMRTVYNQIARNSSNKVKLDINQVDGLEYLEKIPFITEYIGPTGEKYNTIPQMNDWKLQQLKPIIKHLPSWNAELPTNFLFWPKQAKDYIEFIQEQTGFIIGRVGNGPNNGDLININH